MLLSGDGAFSAVTAEAPLPISAVSPLPPEGCVKLHRGSEERDETKDFGFSAIGNKGWEGGLPLNVLPLELGLQSSFGLWDFTAEQSGRYSQGSIKKHVSENTGNLLGTKESPQWLGHVQIPSSGCRPV